MSAEKERTYEANWSLKRRLVDEGRAHAALVYDGTRDLFERAGFELVRSKGTGNCLMRRSLVHP